MISSSSEVKAVKLDLVGAGAATIREFDDDDEEEEEEEEENEEAEAGGGDGEGSGGIIPAAAAAAAAAPAEASHECASNSPIVTGGSLLTTCSTAATLPTLSKIGHDRSETVT